MRLHMQARLQNLKFKPLLLSFCVLLKQLLKGFLEYLENIFQNLWIGYV